MARAIVKTHIRKGRVVQAHPRFVRGRPGKIVADRNSTRTVPLRDARTGRVWGRRAI